MPWVYESHSFWIGMIYGYAVAWIARLLVAAWRRRAP